MRNRLVLGKYKLGWKPDLPDHRDVRYLKSVMQLLPELPPKVDLRAGMPAVYDQGQLGSCTSQAIAAAHAFDQVKQGITPFAPSRLFIYFNERNMEGTINEDSGAMIRDGVKSVADIGVCSEAMWPYIADKFRDKPTDNCYSNALTHQVMVYTRLEGTSLRELKDCLAQGYPIIFGFSVYENFGSEAVARTGMMNMPLGSQLGGHAVICVGYDDGLSRFIVRNSWGEAWGDKGYFYMLYSYMTNSNLCDDFWTIRTIEV